MRAGPMAAVAAAVAARGGQHEDIDAFGCVLGERASHAERFIVGVGSTAINLEEHICHFPFNTGARHASDSAGSRRRCPCPRG